MTHYGSDVVYQELVAVRKGWWASCVLDCVNLHLADFYNHTSHLLVYLYERVLFVLLPSLFTAPTSWFSILCSSHFPFVSDSDKLMHTSRNNGTWTHSLSLITVSSNAHTHTRAHTHTYTHTRWHVRETMALDALEDGGRIICQSCSGITVRFF